MKEIIKMTHFVTYLCNILFLLLLVSAYTCTQEVPIGPICFQLLEMSETFHRQSAC